MLWYILERISRLDAEGALGGKERTREVVVKGVDYLVEGYSGNQEWLGRSLVRPLL